MDSMRRFAEAEPAWLGRFGEALWKRVFEASDIAYIPLCDIENGRAPVMVGGKGKERTVLPDFDVATGKWSAYVDSKVKKQCVLFRKANEARHGIKRRNYAHYKAMAFTHRKQAGVAIVELFDRDGIRWSGALLAESFLNLGEPFEGFSGSLSDTVLFPRKRFVELDCYAPDELLAIANGTMRVSFETELGDIFGKIPRHQKILFA